MGPGCGTAMLGGVGLGFANVVRAGPGRDRRRGRHRRAGGRACLLDAAGVGVSHIVGVGGRDLSADVGGIMFRAGDGAARRPTTAPRRCCSSPSRRTARSSRALGDVDVGGRRVVAAFVGWDGGEAPFEVHPTLEAGALAAAGGVPPGRPRERAGGPAARDGGLLGLYSGGSLAHEAETILERVAGRGNAARARRATDPRPRRGGVHPGPPAPDGRPRACAVGMLRDAAGTTASAACCSTSCSATARTPIRRASLAEHARGARARPARDRARVRHAGATRRTPRRQEATLRDAGVDRRARRTPPPRGSRRSAVLA